MAGLPLLVCLCGCEPPNLNVAETPIKVLSETVGVGPPAQKGDLVTIKYRMVTEEGREILSDDSYRFVLGTGSVIEGMEKAVSGMQVGGKRTVECPPHLHWGRQGYGHGAVPPRATLIVDIELSAID